MDFKHKINSFRSLPSSQWAALANDRLPQVASAILVIAIAWSLARFVWAMIPLQQEFDWSTPASVVADGPVSSQPLPDFSVIIGAHLFGEADAEPEPTAIDAPETRLNLKLRGTIAAGSEEFAHAIIADGNGKDQVFFIDDTVPGGAALHEVYPDKVILNRAGTLETLKLPRLSQALGKQTTSRRAPAQKSPSAGSIRQMMQQNGGSFTDILRPQPYMPNGELKGYRVYPGRDRRRFAALGLRPGDLVTDINGQALNNLQSGMEIFRNLGDASEIAVTIERDGSPITLTLDTSQINNESGNNR